MCALAIQIPTFCPEVLQAMNPKCSRCRVEMLERPGLPGCYVCPRNPEHTCEVEPMGGGQAPPPKQKLTPMPQTNALARRAYGPYGSWINWWQATMGVFGPISQVPQSNASAEYSCMNGPAAPGGGSKSSGRKRKKGKGGKKFTDEPWWGEGGTKRK